MVIEVIQACRVIGELHRVKVSAAPRATAEFPKELRKETARRHGPMPLASAARRFGLLPNCPRQPPESNAKLGRADHVAGSAEVFREMLQGPRVTRR